MMRQKILVYDIGGTKLRCGIYCCDEDKLLSTTELETPSFLIHPDTSFSELRALLYANMVEASKSIGFVPPGIVSVAFAAPIESESIALQAPTIWGRETQAVSLVDELRDMFGQSKIHVINDVTAAGYGYLRHEREDMCIVTVSSGVGNKVFVDGKPVLGPRGLGGEIGHIRVDFSEDAPSCDCGGMGHLGAVASGRATRFQLERLIQRHPEAVDLPALDGLLALDSNCLNEAVASAFHWREDWACRLVDQMTRHLGSVLAAIHVSMGIERFVIVGGFAAALGEDYLDFIGKHASASGWTLSSGWPRMLELGSDKGISGLLGAGRAASRSLRLAGSYA